MSGAEIERIRFIGAISASCDRRGAGALNSVVRNLWFLVATFYVVPLFISFWIILETGNLLGDFASTSVDSSLSALLLVGLLYLLPGILFASIAFGRSELSKKENRRKDVRYSHKIKNFRTNVLFSMLIFTTIGAAIFGLPTISGGPKGGQSSLIQNIILYLNPSLLFTIIAVSRPSFKKLIISSICLAYVGYVQLSLLPFFLVAVGVSTWWFVRYPVGLLVYFQFT